MAGRHLTPLEASISDLAWIEGRWRGECDGEPIEEHWSSPDCGSIMGMFRWMRNGKVRFFELFTVEQEGTGLVLRIKHFDPGLRGWENKDESATFDLAEHRDGEALWLRRGDKKPALLTYRRSGSELDAWFQNPGEAPADDDRFHYSLVP